MRKMIGGTIVLFVAAALAFSSCGDVKITNHEKIEAKQPAAILTTSSSYEPTKQESDHIGAGELEEKISEEDIALMALMTMAEAENQCEEGKRLVIDAVLNRVDSSRFPDTVYEVIYSPNQFSVMWNGRANRCEVREENIRLVKEELESRTNYDVIFFNSGQYSKYGVPMFQVGDHYFSKL
jgi:N-acetylmuramoyl-L-alanine amidase